MLQDLKAQLGSSMHSVRRFLERPISVTQGELTLGVSASALRAKEREQTRKRVRQMKRDLFELLDQHPESRRLLRHLDLVERTLRRNGLETLEMLPAWVIAKALTEMERLVWDWSPLGLAELRSRMAVIVKNRPHHAPPRPARVDEDIVVRELDGTQAAADVTEADHAMFEEMERSWAGRIPQPRVEAQATQPAAA